MERAQMLIHPSIRNDQMIGPFDKDRKHKLLIHHLFPNLQYHSLLILVFQLLIISIIDKRK